MIVLRPVLSLFPWYMTVQPSQIPLQACMNPMHVYPGIQQLQMQRDAVTYFSFHILVAR